MNALANRTAEWDVANGLLIATLRDSLQEYARHPPPPAGACHGGWSNIPMPTGQTVAFGTLVVGAANGGTFLNSDTSICVRAGGTTVVAPNLLTNGSTGMIAISNYCIVDPDRQTQFETNGTWIRVYTGTAAFVTARDLLDDAQSGENPSAPAFPAWLPGVERRIRNSITSSEIVESEEGRWLSRDVADTALGVFRTSADILPGEPYIYASRQGDLVAEFRELTLIVSANRLHLFRGVAGNPTYKTFDVEKETPAALRQTLTEMLHVGKHGTVGADS